MTLREEVALASVFGATGFFGVGLLSEAGLTASLGGLFAHPGLYWFLCGLNSGVCWTLAATSKPKQ